MNADPRPVVLVTGLSGGGKASVLRALEDLGFEAVDNPPLNLIETLAGRPEGGLAIGVDCRTRGFDAAHMLALLSRLRAQVGPRLELVFAEARDEILLRRFTETRRRHPLAPQGRVGDGVAAERALVAPLRAAADLLIDTSDLSLAGLRRTVEAHFGPTAEVAGQAGLALTMISFAFPAGLPREADMVFDVRFLRNPHYDRVLRPRTGLDPAVAAYVRADPDYEAFLVRMDGLLALLLPRFLQEGKKYATIAIGCTGGRHRSVHLVDELTRRLRGANWNVLATHRELDREGMSGGTARGMDSRADSRQEHDLNAPLSPPHQAQEA
ncbi:MAG: RNase adapter RapZ [Acetobacteraceae bacterium]|nr:RNase adapter RapZ [Acetobacteraceae bacterium]